MYKKLIQAYQDIPMIRDGKGSVDALLSLRKDIEQYSKLVKVVLFDPERTNVLIKEWNDYIEMRKTEDFCPWFKSYNELLYHKMFDWRG
jgi:hypothetical protein